MAPLSSGGDFVSIGDISSNGCVFHSHVTFWGGWRVYIFLFKYVGESLVVPYTLSPKLGF